MRTLRVAIAVVLAVIGLAQPSSAQSLTLSLFERYLDSLREQAGIPGLSAAVLQGGSVLKEWGFGRQDLESNTPASPETPYFIADLSQTLGGTVLLKKCVDESYLDTGDLVTRWVPDFPEPLTTVEQLLSHTAPSGLLFHYDATRFALLTPVMDECGGAPYRQLLAQEIFDRLGMASSVPGRALASPTDDDRQLFAPEALTRYAAVLGRLAQPYRVDRERVAIRSEIPNTPASAANGVVTTVRDFARFDSALRILLDSVTLQRAWTQVRINGTPLPTGFGWFVQNYNGEPLVWHLGVAKDAYSSLVLKLPNRDLTLILMANSDGLGSQLALDSGDITTSTFARLVLRLLVS